MTVARTILDIDLTQFRSDDLVYELKDRGELPFGDFDLEKFIRDCRRAFEKKDLEKFEYLMRKLEMEAEEIPQFESSDY